MMHSFWMEKVASAFTLLLLCRNLYYYFVSRVDVIALFNGKHLDVETLCLQHFKNGKKNKHTTKQQQPQTHAYKYMYRTIGERVVKKKCKCKNINH